jgi:hypothetical protein
MKMSFSSLFVAAVLALPVVASAQFARPLQPAPAYCLPHEDPARQAQIMYQLQGLKNTSDLVRRSFTEHCRRSGFTAANPEWELVSLLTILDDDVETLVDEVNGDARGSIGRIYRAFHAVQYSAQDSRALSTQLGYASTVNQYLAVIDNHLQALAVQGFQNPRIRPPQVDGRPQRPTNYPQGQVTLPPQPGVPIPYPGTSPVAPAAPSANDSRDLGDFFGRIFGRRR